MMKSTVYFLETLFGYHISRRKCVLSTNRTKQPRNIKPTVIYQKKISFKNFFIAIKEKKEVQSPLQRKTKPLRFEHFNNKEMKNTIGMWKIESSVFFRGGEVTWASHIQFRNLR